MLRVLLFVGLIGAVASCANPDRFSAAESEAAEAARNPIIFADVPDPSVLRVGDTYYMSSTTMHMSPGVPIMKSDDLVNWEMVGYVYDVLADSDALALRNGENAYGRGSWASSLRYRDGTYYLATFSYSTGATHIYRTQDLEKGPWIEARLDSAYHDPSLHFEEDGRAYLVTGNDDIRLIELTRDASAVRSGGLDRIIVPDASQIAGERFIVGAEGSHLYKINGKYYLFLIVWPENDMRTQLVYRSDELTGPYEGRVALRHAGIAQGGIVETPEGDWFAVLFQDHGAVGRIPYLVPVTWEDDWPVLGVDGEVPELLDLPASRGLDPGIVGSDEFDWTLPTDLPLVWQWNHNPVAAFWSTSARPGHLRLTNGRIDTGLLDTQNTLTQRTFGPTATAEVALDVEGLKDGDTAGLGLLQRHYGYVGVAQDDGARYVVMVNAGSEAPVEAARLPLEANRVYFRAEADFTERTDRARFLFSTNGSDWMPIGDTLRMSYTLPHFMGYRFALFSFATQRTGGFADFDYFRLR